MRGPPHLARPTTADFSSSARLVSKRTADLLLGCCWWSSYNQQLLSSVSSSPAAPRDGARREKKAHCSCECWFSQRNNCARVTPVHLRWRLFGSHGGLLPSSTMMKGISPPPPRARGDDPMALPLLWQQHQWWGDSSDHIVLPPLHGALAHCVLQPRELQQRPRVPARHL